MEWAPRVQAEPLTCFLVLVVCTALPHYMQGIKSASENSAAHDISTISCRAGLIAVVAATAMMMMMMIMMITLTGAI